MAGMQTDVRRRKFAKAFDAFDANNSGYFTKDEVTAFAGKMSSEFGHSPGSAQARAFQQACDKMWQSLRKLDKNNDEQISREEYIDYVVNASPQEINAIIDPYVDGMFALADTDGDQQISKDEFARHQRVTGLTDTDIKGTFDQLDRDGNGYLSKAEYREYLRDFFVSSDPNAAGNQLIGGI